MTREEAIRIIETVFQDEYVYKYYDSITHQALDMAIEALTQDSRKVTQDSTQDLIIRQDAIEAIAKRIYHIEDGNENDALRKAICDIDALPSVNAIPYDSTVTLNSPTIIKATSTDLISRQDAVEAIRNYYPVRGRSSAMACLTQCKSVSVDKEYFVDLIQEAVYDGEACAKLMDMVDRPKGRWLSGDCKGAHCSVCDEYTPFTTAGRSYPFCPNCGARMF